jgi:hypothetical protein
MDLSCGDGTDAMPDGSGSARFPPILDVDAIPFAAREAAAATWQQLLEQEDRSRAFSTRVAGDLERLGAPGTILRAARRVVADEARHVFLCEHLVRELGFVPTRPSVELKPLPEDDEGFELAMAEIVVAGFAVGETMSVGGFAAISAVASEPLVCATLRELTRDEARHGAFGEHAGAWLLRGWSAERRHALWPACVAAMESFEQRAGGRPGARPEVDCAPELAALGAPGPRVGAAGVLDAVSRWVLPRLTRLGIIDGPSESR